MRNQKRSRKRRNPKTPNPPTKNLERESHDPIDPSPKESSKDLMLNICLTVKPLSTRIQAKTLPKESVYSCGKNLSK
jgi:hypothetical protein